MSEEENGLEEEILELYREPVIGSGYGNTYGEQNLVALVEKYRMLSDKGMLFMSDLVTAYSTSTDLATSYISVGVLHAIGLKGEVEKAYDWAKTQDEAASITSHFDIGKSLSDHFIKKL